MKISNLLESEFSFDEVKDAIYDMRKAHIAKIEAALKAIPGVKNVKVKLPGTLYDSFKYTSFSFEYLGRAATADMSHTGYSLGASFGRDMYTPQCRNTRTLKAAMDKVLKKESK